MFSKMTTGFKLFLTVLIVGSIVGLVYYFQDDIKSTENQNVSWNSTSDDKDVIDIGLNTWAGFAGIVYMNGGLKPNEESRLFKEFGIKLNIKISDVFVDCRSDFKSGKLDIIYCTTDALPVEMGKDGDMAQIGIDQFFQLDWSRGGDAIVVVKGINTVSDLKNKTIAVAEGTASHSLLIKTLESNSLTPADVKLKKVGDGIEAAKLFKAGECDAAVVWAPDDADCLDAIKGSKVLVSTKTATNIIADGLLARKSYIKENFDKLVKLCEGWLIGNSELNNNESIKREAIRIFAKEFNIDEGWVELGISNVRYTTLGDNIDFFGLNSQYIGMTGEQLYTKMSIVYSNINLTESPVAWRMCSNTTIIQKLMELPIMKDEKQISEAGFSFDKPTEEIKKKEAISNKKITINFDVNSHFLSDEAKSIIDREFVNIAKTFGNARIRIEGNTDNTGNYNYNIKLSEKRAQSVADYLSKECGFDTDRFIVVGNGPKHAVSDGVNGSNLDYRTTDFQLIEK